MLAAALGGCSMFESKKIDYKSSGTLPPLEAPPDLVLPERDNRFAVPDTAPRGAATLSEFERERGGKGAARSSSGAKGLLPAVDKVSVERAGTQRWLVVGLPAAEVWPVVREFWQELGFVIVQEVPESGVMETDWAENRAKIPQDALRRMLSSVLDGLYSTAERDKFRTRLEPRADGGTEIYISHRGMIEVFEGTQTGGDQGQGRTVWQPRPSDIELEADMLRRLMARFGVEEARAASQLAAPVEPRARLAKAADGAPGLALPDAFDRAWRRVGLALDRIGFTVEDRDRSAGVYYVRYADPDAEVKTKKGFLSSLAFWRDDEAKAQALRYQVRVKEAGEASQLAVYHDDGRPAGNDTGNRIATLLLEQLK